MTFSKENPVGKNQLENTISSSNDSSPEKAEQLSALLALLFDLDIINGGKKKQQAVVALKQDEEIREEEKDEDLAGYQEWDESAAPVEKRSPEIGKKPWREELETEDRVIKNSIPTPIVADSEEARENREEIAETQKDSLSWEGYQSKVGQWDSTSTPQQTGDGGEIDRPSELNIEELENADNKADEEVEIALFSSRSILNKNGNVETAPLTSRSLLNENGNGKANQQNGKFDRGEKSNLEIQSSEVEEKVEESEKQSNSTELEDENIEGLYDAYKRLQSALVGPELEELHEIIGKFETKVTTIEHQIYNPTELINLLLPVISEILNRKVSESSESKNSVAEAIIPIVDEVIKIKTREDRYAMGRAIAPAMPTAISETVRDSPSEIGRAIGPDIAVAIAEQIRLDRDAIIRALYPIIHQVIESKREEDIDALSTAIAPLLPPAISEQIRNSPQEIAQAIGPEMAAAFREQVRLDRDAMIEALAPEMGKTIKAQIEIERDAMVDALYPVIGNTIAKYMADVIRTINEKIENTLSMEGINRKFRAKMQGVSEAELIVKEAVPFTVRAAFLIHKQSGLVISEVQTSGEQKLEADMVAGMLTAIRSFVNDCIAQSGNISEIDSIDYGNSKIILEVAGYCYLAVATQGDIPQWFIYRIQQTLLRIVEIAGDRIENYEGDPSVIPEKVLEILESLANIQRTNKKASIPIGLLLISSVAAALILLPFGYFNYRNSVERDIAKETKLALTSAPELAIYNLSVDVDNDKLRLSGKLPNQYLRQRAEQIAKKVAPTQTLENQIIAVEVPPDPVLTASEVKRVTAALNQLTGMAITSRYTDQKVTVEGTVAQAGDSQKITQAFKQIPGVKAITNTVQLQQLSLPLRIYFEAGKTELKAENKDKILQVKAFLLRYPENTLTIIGHSDTKGSSATNQRLALLRAETVREILIAEGINSKRLQAVATPNPPLGLDSSKPLWLSRCVRFQSVSPGLPRK